ncbi:MAG: hypothetical protein D6815_09595, partial [Candidatus Dadabacteria bacterium]
MGSIDEVARTITLVLEYAEGGNIFNWVVSNATGSPGKRSMSIIEESGGVEVSRRNYFEVFPIRYELFEGFG